VAVSRAAPRGGVFDVHNTQCMADWRLALSRLARAPLLHAEVGACSQGVGVTLSDPKTL
jgi:hypothetical protein